MTLPLDRLTSRHLQVLDYLSRGHTREKTAEKMLLPRSTVQYYAKDICVILRAANIVEAVRIAFDHGVLKPTAPPADTPVAPTVAAAPVRAPIPGPPSRPAKRGQPPISLLDPRLFPIDLSSFGPDALIGRGVA